jgi:hypothetical protein
MSLRRSPRLAAKAAAPLPQGPRRSTRLAAKAPKVIPDNTPLVRTTISRHSTPKEIIIYYSNEWGFTYTDDLLTQFERDAREVCWWFTNAIPIEQQIKHWLKWECPTTSEQIMDMRIAKCLQHRCVRYRITYSQDIFNKFIQWVTNPASDFPGGVYDGFVERYLVPKYKYIRLLSIPQCVDAFFAAYRKSL